MIFSDLVFLCSLDIPVALGGSLFSTEDPNGGFMVHWLNNKDLSFTTSMDLFMQQLRKLSEQQLEQGTEEIDPEGSPMKFDFGTDLRPQRHFNRETYSVQTEELVIILYRRKPTP